MSEITPMASVEPVIDGVLKITWRDGHVGVVDLRSIIAEGEMFAFLRDEPLAFPAVRLEAHGHKIYWLDPDGDEIDFGSHALRERAERQAKILRLAS
jgi:hypothetical protein